MSSASLVINVSFTFAGATIALEEIKSCAVLQRDTHVGCRAAVEFVPVNDVAGHHICAGELAFGSGLDASDNIVDCCIQICELVLVGAMRFMSLHRPC